MPQSFTPELFAFLRELKQNNEREWFKANQARYEACVREPALRFVEDFAPRLERISPHFLALAKKVGGSLFRIHRDTRFSPDKSPYKTHTGIQFRHEAGKDAHAPCFYLHLDPERVFVAAGIWHPDSATARAIREGIVADPEGWRKLFKRKAFKQRFQLEGDSLKRAPRGFDAEHPLIEDLRRKDFIAVMELELEQVSAPDLLQTFGAACKAAAPLVEFLCQSLELDF